MVTDLAPVEAQTTCRAADSYSTSVINKIKNLVTSTHPNVVATGIALQLPVVATSKITLVTDSKVCTKALAAYNAVLGSRGTGPTTSTQVAVVKVGTNRFVVADPSQTGGEWIYQMVMDNRYALSKVSGG